MTGQTNRTVNRPKVAPEIPARLAEDAPARVVRKLDKDPAQADGWTWARDGETWTVTTPRDEVVTLVARDGVVATGEDARCSCLLAPRCLHLLAVVSRLELEGGAETESEFESESAAEPETVGAAETESETMAETVTVDDRQREAAARIAAATAELLERGALASGAVAQSQLLRATHACRLVGLHRLARAGLRTVQRVRDLRDASPSLPLSSLVIDVLDLLATGRTIASQTDVDVAHLGRARQAYAPLGALSVHGLCSEAIASSDGYAGVVSHVVDGDGRLWSVADVRGGGGSRIAGAYVGPIGLGSSITHRELARSRLLIQGATGSREGRLGSGAKVRAVTGGASSWNDEAVARLFRTPVAEQLDRVWTVVDPIDRRPRSAEPLLCARGQVLGASDDALWLGLTDDEPADPLVVRAVTSGDTGTDNLRALAQAPGMPIRMVGRIDPGRARTIRLLAVGPAEDDDAAVRLTLPDEWGTVCNIGLDRLQRAAIHGVAPQAHRIEETPAPDPFVALRRRLERVVMGGRGTLSSGVAVEVQREAQRLRQRMCPTGADLLRELTTQALDTGRAVDGRRLGADPDALARAWLAAALWERVAGLSLVQSSWTR